MKRNRKLSGEATDAINGLLLWRSSCPEEFVDKLGRLIWEVIKADPDEDGIDDIAHRMLGPMAGAH